MSDDDGSSDREIFDEGHAPPDRTATDWYAADPVFRAIDEQFGFVQFRDDVNLATDVLFVNEKRLAARGFRRQDGGLWEMQYFAARRYLAHKAYAPLIDWLVAKASVPTDDELVLVRDTLIEAGELTLLDRLYDDIRKKHARRLITGWHGYEVARKREPTLPPATEAFAGKLEQMIADWYDPAIALFERLDEPAIVARWREERAWLLERRFLDRKPLPRPEKVTVDDDFLWQVLHEVAEGEPDPERRPEALRERLERYGAPAIRAFAKRYQRLGDQLLHHDVRALVALAYESTSMDLFFDFCEELFWRGEREVFEGIVARPLEILERLPPADELHGMATLEEAIDRASLARSGRPIAWREGRVAWRGRPWKTAELEARYPELAAQL